MKKVLAVSIFAIMAVGAARADIASTDYVRGAIAGKQDTLTQANNAGEHITISTAGVIDTTGLATSDELDAVDATAKAAQAAADKAASDAKGAYQVKSTAEYQMGGANGTWKTMTTEQQAALNSGVKASDVAQIETNKNGIASNKSAIETNTSAIEANKTDIATNKADIATNTSGVAANKAAIEKLNGSGEGSVTKKITDALGSYSTTETVQGMIDTATSDMLTKTDASTTYATKAEATYTGDGTIITVADNKISADLSAYTNTTGMNDAIDAKVNAAKTTLTEAINEKYDTDKTTVTKSTVVAAGKTVGQNLDALDDAVKEARADLVKLQSDYSNTSSEFATVQSTVQTHGNQIKALEDEAKTHATKTELTEGLNKKQDKLEAGKNINGTNGVSVTANGDGNVTITGTAASNAAAGVTKLYDAIGTQADGAITPKAVNGLKTTVEGNTTKITNLTERVTKTEGDVTNLTTNVTNLQEVVGEVGNLSEELDKKQDKIANVTDTAKKGEVVTAVSQTDGKISVTRATLNLADIDMSGIGSGEGVAVLTYSTEGGWKLESIDRTFK